MNDDEMAIADLLVQLGRDEVGDGRGVNLPLHQTSTMLFDTMAAFEAAKASRYEPGALYYGRYGTPASFELETALAKLDGADHCVAVSSGLTALTIAATTFVEAGSEIVVADSVYGPTRAFCDNVLRRFGIGVSYFDPMNLDDLDAKMNARTSAVLFEAPASQTFEVPNIEAIAARANHNGAVSILDGTWATPLYCRPMRLGVDIVAHSGSKFISGHADVMIGFMTCRAPHYAALRKMALLFGDRAGSMDVYLSLRGLRTLEVRLQRSSQSARRIAEWLQAHPAVKAVLHPALPSCPGHDNWRRQFSGASGLFSFVLHETDISKVHSFIDGLAMFSIGLSWGGYESLAVSLSPHALRTATPWTEEGALVRLSIGLEDADTLINDLSSNMSHLALAREGEP